jgi:hypothetical protein
MLFERQREVVCLPKLIKFESDKCCFTLEKHPPKPLGRNACPRRSLPCVVKTISFFNKYYFIYLYFVSISLITRECWIDRNNGHFERGLIALHRFVVEDILNSRGGTVGNNVADTEISDIIPYSVGRTIPACVRYLFQFIFLLVFTCETLIVPCLGRCCLL